MGLAHHVSNVNYRKGSMDLVTVAVTDVDIEAGSLMYIVTAAGADQGKCEPARLFTWTTDLATTQAAFAAVYAGVAREPKEAGDGKTEITIDRGSDSVYEYSCTSATFHLFEELGPAKDTGNNLLDRKLEKVGTTAAAIARVAQIAPTATTKVYVKLGSSVGVNNPNAKVGA